MQTSDGQIYDLLRNAMERIGVIRKEQRGQGFNFRGRDTVVNAVNPVLAEIGITVHCVKTEIAHREMNRTADKIDNRSGDTTPGKALYGTILLCTYRWTAPDGSYIDVQTAGEGFDMSDKATGKAHSYALRECLVDTLLVKTDDPEPDAVRPGVDKDDDINAAWVTLVKDVSRLRGQNREIKAGVWIKAVLRHMFDTDSLKTIEGVEPMDALAHLRVACLATPARYDRDTADPIETETKDDTAPDIERGGH